MIWRFIVIYAHVIAAILVVGYTLFWAVMTGAARRAATAEEASRLLRYARAANWPLPAVRPRLTTIGWLLLTVSVVTGLLCLPGGFSTGQLFSGQWFGSLLLTKMVLLAILVVCFPRLGFGGTAFALSGLLLALAIVVVSALSIR